MRITFTHVDEEYYGVQQLIEPVVSIAIAYDVFICIMCEILNLFDSYSEHIVNDVKKALGLYKYRLNSEDEKMLADYNTFATLVENFYWNVVDDDFGLEIKKFNDIQYYRENLRYPDKRLGRYRGLLFEELVIAIVKDRFNDDSFSTGCQIYVNNTRVIARYGEGNSYHKETIDIAGWVELVKYGEFYECKISPKRFGEENYRYFVELKKVLDDNKVNNYRIGFVSADARTNLEIQKQYLEDNNQKCNIDFELLGREDIYTMKSFSVPEIA